VTWFAVVVLTFDLVLKSVKSTLRWTLKGLERFGLEAVSLLFERTLLLVLCLGVLEAGHGVRGFVLAFLAVRLVDTTALVAYVQRRRPAPDATLRRAALGDLFRKGLPFAYAGAMITLVFQVDTVILEKMRGAIEVGWYGSPVLVLEGLTLVPRILGYALIPTMAALGGHAAGSRGGALPARVEVPAPRRAAHRRLRPARVGPVRRDALRSHLRAERRPRASPPARGHVHVPLQLRRDRARLRQSLGHDRRRLHAWPWSSTWR
jgi:hypothetical protein